MITQFAAALADADVFDDMSSVSSDEDITSPATSASRRQSKQTKPSASLELGFGDCASFQQRDVTVEAASSVTDVRQLSWFPFYVS